MRSEIFPVGLRMQGRLAVVVGSGAAAELRVRALREAGARVRVVSERPTSALAELTAQGLVELHERAFDETDLEGAVLAILTDLDAALAERLDRATAARRLFFCAVDQPAFGSFSHLAIAREGDVTVAVSTSGRAPALSRKLREELERVLRQSKLAAFVERLAALREKTPSVDRQRVLGEAVRGVRLTGKLRFPWDDENGR